MITIINSAAVQVRVKDELEILHVAGNQTWGQIHASVFELQIQIQILPFMSVFQIQIQILIFVFEILREIQRTI